MKPIIEVKGLWKEYQRGAQKERYLSIRDQLSNAFRPSRSKESFWALEDINFQVDPGESLAIIGKNGAGKSTLLKILSKITPPSKGELILRGRMASLLEVGTGFHPELTGKENIFLNGSILGLSRKEIEAQFDAIVDFSGVETFLSTPLKHYSSGMQLRLAFAVAAHLEPEILVIDEVLAVGDSVFQQKCIDKMTEVSRSGRTILFVSHNMQAVRNLCQRGILLEQGKSIAQGPVDELLEIYSSSTELPSIFKDLRGIQGRRGSGEIRYKNISLNKDTISIGDDLIITLGLDTPHSEKAKDDLDFGIAIVDKMGNNIHHFSNRFLSKSVPRHEDGATYSFSFNARLRPGLYDLTLFLRSSDTIQDWFQIDNVFRVEDSNLYGYNNSGGIGALVQDPFQFDVRPKEKAQ